MWHYWPRLLRESSLRPERHCEVGAFGAGGRQDRGPVTEVVALIDGFRVWCRHDKAGHEHLGRNHLCMISIR
jgi:hypothetical protein